MATAARDSTLYGGGAGGKFRKNPSRRSQTTPYDRPPTALRSTQIYNNNNNSNGGWLSRIVDPASKLISASARKFYTSVFRKGLLPPPQAPPDEKVHPSENHVRHAINEDPSRIQVREMNVEKTQIHGPITTGVVELEHMLKQKTFTRSEIDRLTALLHSRTVDKTGVSEKRGFEVTKPSELPAGNYSREEFDGAANENGFSPSEGIDLTPAFRSKVNEDDVASPADLAKAYMGTRSTKVSLSRFGLWNHTAREESPARSSFQLHRPTMSTVQKPLSTPGTSQSDFVISRSRGRSAIYNMARTPYSRVQPTATKASGSSNGAFDGQHLSSHKPLKRRSSILENDIGSVGPIRRIRQKSNLLYPKTLGISSSHTPLTHATRSEVTEDRGDKSLPVSSSHVHSKSIEMGQRILQQLEMLTPPREKSSEKESRASGGISTMEFTPGVLHGQAHKNLETGGSLKCLPSGEVNCRKTDPHAVAFCEVRDSTPRIQGNVHDSGSKVLMDPAYKAYPENNEAKISNGDIRVGSNCSDPVVSKSTDDVPKKNQALQIKEHEDHLKLDDSRMHLNSNMLLENPSFPEAAKADNPAFPEVQPFSNSLLKKNIVVDSSTLAEKNVSHNSAMDDALKKKNGFSASPIKPDECSQTYLSDKADDFPSSVLASAADTTDAALKSPGSNNKVTEAVNIAKQSVITPLFSFPGSTMTANVSNGNINSIGSCHVTSSAPSPILFPSRSSSSGSSAQCLFTASTTTTVNAGVFANNVGSDANCTTATVNGNSSNSTNSIPASFGTPSSADVGSHFGPSANGVLQASDNVFSPVISGQQVLPSATVASTTQSMPSQPAASVLPVSSGPNSLGINSGVDHLGSLTSVSGSTGSASTSIFDSTSWQPSSSPVFGSTINSSSGPTFGSSSASTPSISASSGFALETSSVSVPANGSLSGVTPPSVFASSSTSAPSSTTTPPFVFGSPAASATATPASLFPFASTAASTNTLQPSQSVFGNGNPVFAIGSTSSHSPLPNSDQMSMDTMVEDNNRSSAPTAPPSSFVQSPANPFVFGGNPPASSPLGSNPFQQNQFTPTQNPFQASGSFDGSGPFSLGAGGNDKSNRRIVKVARRVRKK